MHWTWAVTLAAIFGNILNVKRSRYCFAVWALTNTAFIIHNVAIAEYAQVALFAVYLALSVWGWFAWRPWNSGE